ncbi:WD40 repeat-like protein [Sistotremastrum suecicum HHB10207 ss-3]|uniref:ASTRA-associated protein 1 n=1 Tax=Sistotremastrum suecicum HHB10207 ss-3 TaxID=1314776 RepID=A0A166E2I1_9AGAM|nr:WD40 repeat-like protein [Sistotremastrum suecicum HHB10207 ss-3]
MPPPPPSPAHILRLHGSQINDLSFSPDNERLYAGDADGHVTISSTITLRPIANWKPHSDGLLGIQEWNEFIITQGRDNKLHIWQRPGKAAQLTETAGSPDLATPQLLKTLDVNSLNYCRFSIMNLYDTTDLGYTGMLAIPNLVDSSVADIWSLPSLTRIHAAVGKWDVEGPIPVDGRGDTKTESSSRRRLKLLAAYENGSVTLWGFSEGLGDMSVESKGWNEIWSSRIHVETVMAMAVTPENRVAFTVSADHIIGQYPMEQTESESTNASPTIHRTKYPGNAAIAMRSDGRIFATGGWDGKVRLYSTKSCKPLGTLSYHRESCRAIAFANQNYEGFASDDADESDDDIEERLERKHWFAAGGKEGRISLWKLMDFTKK